MITLKDYLMGRDKEYPLTVELAMNACDLLSRVNYLLAKLGIKTKLTSGYRPGHYNKAAGGSLKSAHLLCMAIDLNDPTGVIGSTLKNNVKLLEECGLWLENPDKTTRQNASGGFSSWVHLDTRPRNNRIFNP